MLKLFKVFSFKKSLERLVLYAPHIHMQKNNTIKIRNNTPIIANIIKTTPN
jgi:hypothetical protein